MSDLEPRKMSNLSERILASIDFEAVRRIRKENFKMLNDWLGGVVDVRWRKWMRRRFRYVTPIIHMMSDSGNGSVITGYL